MKKRSIIALLMVAILLIGMFSGCADGSADGESQGAESESQEDLKAMIGNYPIADESNPLTLKIWSTMGDTIANDIKDFNDILAFQEMEERTGIHIEWEHAVSGQDTEASNLMLASRDLPDLIRNNIGSEGKEAIKYVQDDVIIDISPYMEYAPNFKGILDENPDLYAIFMK